MSETITNLKVRFGADTKNFRKDLESGKTAVDDMTGSAKSSLSAFAEVFGVNIDKVLKSLSEFKASLFALGGGFSGAAAGSGKLSAALRILRLALISTGVGAIVVAFGSLVSYFTKTERGAEAVEKVMGSFKAIINVLIDRLSIFGEGLYKIFTGEFKDGWETLKKSVAGVGSEIAKESKQAWELTKALQAVEDREIALIEVQGQRRQKIEELRLKAKDLTLTEGERLKALNEAIGLEKKIAADEISIQKERVRIQEAQLKMGELMDDDKRALAESKTKLNDLEAASLSTIRGMTREYNTLTKSIEENNNKVDEAIIKRIDLEKEDSKGLTSLKPVDSSLKTEWKLITDEKGNEKWAKVLTEGFETNKLEASANSAKSVLSDLNETSVNIGASIADAMDSLAVSFGENLGLMIAGSSEAKSMNEILGAVFGDMLVSIGKATIAAGTGFFALAQMFRIGIASPGAAIAAIAAGVAMVAIGSAFKSAANSAASGSTFSSANTGDNSGSIGNTSPGSYRSQPQTINITGTFRAQGKDLVAVIDKNAFTKKINT